MLALYGNVDELKTGLPEVVRDSLREYGAEKIIAENPELQQAAQFCKLKPEFAECNQFTAFKKDPATLLEQPQIQEQYQQFQEQIDAAIEQGGKYEQQAQLGFMGGIGLLILGGLLVWLGSAGLLAAGKSLGWSLGFSGLFSFLLYQFGVPAGLDAVGKQLLESLTGNLSGLYGVLADNAYQYVIDFVLAGLSRVAGLALGIAVAGFVVALICWLVEKQKFKKVAAKK